MIFVLRGHSFNTCQEAMTHLSNIMSSMRKRQGEKSYEVFRHSEWMSLADDFLALAEMCERRPTKYFEHYPRLGREFAVRVIEQAYFGDNESIVKRYARSYVKCFDLDEYLQREEE